LKKKFLRKNQKKKKKKKEGNKKKKKHTMNGFSVCSNNFMSCFRKAGNESSNFKSGNILTFCKTINSKADPSFKDYLVIVQDLITASPSHQ